MSRREILRIDALSVGYTTPQGMLPAVRAASLRVHARESVGLVGESGSGKTTLALGAVGYLPAGGRILGGEARLEGRLLTGLPAGELRSLWGRRIGVVYQNPAAALNPALTVGRQLEEAAGVQLGLKGRAARERVLEMLAKVAMPDPLSVARRHPHQLSGGMAQRCLIAMALLPDPCLLILDEPTTALDVTTQAVVLDLVAELKGRLEAGILYITHDLAVVARVCDRVAVMYAGEILEEGPVARVYARPRHPYTLGLLASAPRFTPGAAGALPAEIPGALPRPGRLPPGCVFAPRCAFVRPHCLAGRPPLLPVEEDRSSACLRWSELPDALPRPELPAEPVAPEGRPVLAARELVRHFPAESRLFGSRRGRKVRALDGVSLALARTATLGVVGESGCGKTTLARAIAGLGPATRGSLRLRGRPLPADAARRRRSDLARLQMVFQDPDSSLNPSLSVGRALGRPLTLLGGLSRREVPAAVGRLLEMVNLPPDFARRLPGELSGGEKQRVAIARAFAARPEVVLLDEPLSALDVSVQASLIRLLARMQRASSAAYLLISHDLAAVQHLAGSVAVMYLGTIVECGKAEEVFAPPYHPYTEALVSAIPSAAAAVPRVRLEGGVPSALAIPSGCRFHTRCPRKLGAICETVEPPWREGRAGHRIRCHIPLDELSGLQKGAT